MVNVGKNNITPKYPSPFQQLQLKLLKNSGIEFHKTTLVKAK